MLKLGCSAPCRSRTLVVDGAMVVHFVPIGTWCVRRVVRVTHDLDGVCTKACCR
jgi:hypothetical protein